MVNARTKGAVGEREVAALLNKIVAKVRADQGFPVLEKRDEIFQRNQNQSAVGGSDLTNCLGLAIEVKRQQTLSIEAWWKQCIESATRVDGIPILIFRQNGKPWRVCMFGELPFSLVGVKCEITIDLFKQWFARYYYVYLREINNS